jgi:hypothetical protein
MSVKRSALLVTFVVALAVTTIWLFIWSSGQHRGAKVSVKLLGYTNDVAGIPVFGYAGSNVVQSSGFALFSAQNRTRSHFGCCLSCILVRQADTGKAQVIQLKGAIYSAQTNQNRAMLNGLDFQLPPGATVAFSVPKPDVRGPWQCFLSLTHVYNYKHQWQFEAAVFAQRLGLHFGENGQRVSSGEIAQ